MYVPKHFSEKREEEIARIIDQFPLGTLITSNRSGVDGNHLPLLLEREKNGSFSLVGHIAKANPLNVDVKDEDNVLVIFKSWDGYISPNWYPSRKTNLAHVPTWNYQVVHCYGTINFVRSSEFIFDVIDRLTSIQENKVGGKNPWNINDMPSDILGAMIKQVVGIRIDVDKLIAKSKLSQNRDIKDFNGVIKNLENINNRAFANTMRNLNREM